MISGRGKRIENNVGECTGPIGKDPNDTSVCSGHGKCILKYHSDCPTGWEGNDCSVPQCYGKSIVLTCLFMERNLYIKR